MVGKTNMDQFAAGLVGTRTPFGIAPNCFDSRWGFSALQLILPSDILVFITSGNSLHFFAVISALRHKTCPRRTALDSIVLPCTQLPHPEMNCISSNL